MCTCPSAIDASLPCVVGGERQRPLAIAPVQVGEVARRRAGRSLGIEPIVAPAVDHEPEAASGRAAKLPETTLAGAAAGRGPELALDDREQSQIGRQAVLTEDRAEARQVRRAARQAVLGGPSQRRLGAQPLFPLVDTGIPHRLETRRSRPGWRCGGDASGWCRRRPVRAQTRHRRTRCRQRGQRRERPSAAHAAGEQADCRSIDAAQRICVPSERRRGLAAPGSASASAASAARTTVSGDPGARSVTPGGTGSTRA